MTMDAPFGGFTEEALEAYQKALAEKEGQDFSEGETYDFARCVRADGSFYGTRGKCKSGTEAGAKEEEAPKTKGGKKRRATVEAKKEAKAASRAAAGAKVSANASRTRALKEELEKIKDKMKGASPEEQNRLIQGAMNRATERAGAGEGKPKRKLATSAEAKPAWQQTERVVKAAKENYKKVNAETKGDKSREAQKKRLDAGRALDKAERLAQKASDKLEAAMKRESRAAMTPGQRKQEREWQKTKKRLG